MTVTVIIVTLNRPDCVRRCLECLEAQEPRPDQVIIVDASPDDKTRQVVADFPTVLYLRNEKGYGRMTASRNIGLKAAAGNIIAFLDDDAFAHPGWLMNLLATYAADSIGAVGGRALNNQPNEAVLGADQIGQLMPNGVLTGYFAADPGKIIEVDHIVGCNMSFRRTVLAQLGGLREEYPGTEVREETDICVRVKKLGYRILFNPAACVDHIGSPQVKGKRFDTRYDYYGQRNHIVLLTRNFGPFAKIVWYYLAYSGLRTVSAFLRRCVGAFARLGAVLSGTLIGIVAGLTLLTQKGRDPIRRDSDGEQIRQALSQVPEPASKAGASAAVLEPL